MSLATNGFPCLPTGFLVWKQMHDLRRKLFLLAALPMWEAYAKEFFFLSRTLLMKEVEPFFYYVLDIWMDLISDLVTIWLARLNLPLELNFQCIELCQIILVLWFFMHYVHENVVVGIDLWWFPYIIQKILFFLDFLRLFSILLPYFGCKTAGTLFSMRWTYGTLLQLCGHLYQTNSWIVT